MFVKHKQGVIDFGLDKSKIKYGTRKPTEPSSRSLFKAIDCLVKRADIILKSIINKSFWLLYKHLIQRSMKKKKSIRNI